MPLQGHEILRTSNDGFGLKTKFNFLPFDGFSLPLQKI